MIGAGTQVTGGSVNVDATDELIVISQNGDFITGGSTVGVGASVNYLEVNRKLHAYIGDLDGTSLDASNSQFDPGAKITVNATSDGFTLSFALAATVKVEGDEPQDNGQINAPDPQDDDADAG